ncbi:MAG: hypothetical protein Q4F75_03950 [Pseudomonadota bacterium]|nr:hypothetical protein [Pseudomonadota bacterium]
MKLVKHIFVDDFSFYNKFEMTLKTTRRRTLEITFVLLSSSFLTDNALAQCTAMVDCVGLGYTQTYNSGDCLKCPIGNFWFCNENGPCINPCPGYTETSIPNSYVQDGDSCTDCDGSPLYKIKPYDCGDKFKDCSATGAADGAQSCLSGDQTLYDNCKPCPNLGKLTSCPTGYKCIYEKCSGKYYKVDGCAPDYDWDASSQSCTEHCYYRCSATSCPANSTNCEREACSGKYCYSCQPSYQDQNGQCICPNKGTVTSCPWGHKCEKEQCSGKYIDYGCDTAMGFVFNSSLNACQCTQDPPYAKTRYKIYGVEDCSGYYRESYQKCGTQVYGCADGKSAHVDKNKKCEFLADRNVYQVTYSEKDYFGCVDQNGSLLSGKGEFCEFTGYTSKEFKTLSECEAALKTYPDPAIGGLGKCEGPCS